VALDALTGLQPLAELAARYQLLVVPISRWKLPPCQQAAHVFAETVAPLPALPNLEPLYAASGRLEMENTI